MSRERSSGSAERTWALTDAALHHRRYGDEVVVYHAETGDTSLLAPPQWEALQLLRHGPCTTARVCEHLQIRLGLDDIDERGWQIERMLGSLAQLNLLQSMAE